MARTPPTSSVVIFAGLCATGVAQSCIPAAILPGTAFQLGVSAVAPEIVTVSPSCEEPGPGAPMIVRPESAGVRVMVSFMR